MRIMTVDATILHRRMLEKIGSAFIRVTLIAGFIDRSGLE
jgi:hypothetical protein